MLPPSGSGRLATFSSQVRCDAIATPKTKGTMKTKEITIAGKTVTLAYCYATEIAYKDYAGEDISTIITEAAQAVNSAPARMPDIKKTIFLVLAAALAYAEYKEEDCAIRDTDLMNDAEPEDLGTALGTVITLWADFYHLSPDEPKEKKKGKRGKNS